MKNFETAASNLQSKTSLLFLIARAAMLINTVALWSRHFSEYSLTILWAAIPAIVGLVCAAFGLFKLRTLLTSDAPKMACVGSGFSVLALSALGVAATWIFAMSVFGEGMPQPAPAGFMVLIAVFMVSVILAFAINAIAFLFSSQHLKIGWCLSVPVIMWGLMLVVGFVKGMNVGLSLDFYTNPIIGAAFIAITLSLKKV